MMASPAAVHEGAHLARKTLLLTVAAIICAASASTQARPEQPGFTYDHQLAVDLGRAYGTALARAMASRLPGKLDLNHPTVIARTFKGNRRLVQVSYRSTHSGVGAVVVLALCREGELTWADSAYWEGERMSPVEEFAQANSDTYYATAPDRCPGADGAP